jgi:serine/threonine protein kinase
MSLLRDLDDYKLETDFDNTRNQVIHRSYRADWACGRGRIAVEERWTPGEVVGTGAFGVVRLETQQDAARSARQQYRAVKQLRKLDMKFKRVDFHKELLALTKFSREKFVRSQAFVQFLGWFEDSDHIYLAMEYFEHGTLDKFITKDLSERDAQIIAHQLLLGLKIMHQEHFAHRDMKPNASLLSLERRLQRTLC